MPYSRPTLTQLRQQAVQDVQSGGITGVTALLRFSVLYVLAMVLAGLSNLHFGFIDWISKQAIPATATDEFLESWGALKVVYKKAASAGSGSVSFPVSSAETIPTGTTIIAGGVTCLTTDVSVTTNGVTVAPCLAQTAGAASNVALNALATLGSPVEGVQTSGTVTTAFSGGADEETDDEYRVRVLDAYAAGGENGNEQDYINWALDVAGVTRAWCDPIGMGAGTVVIFFMMDDARSSDAGFPQGTNGAATSESRYTTATGDQLTVADAIYPKRPVTALVIACAPVAQATDFSITGLGDDNTSDNQDAITSALSDMFTRLSEPGGTIAPNQWYEAINAIGLTSFVVASPTAAITATGSGYMPTLGAVTFAT